MVDKFERNKDLVQEMVESTATRVGRITSIITGAVADIAREVGDLITDGFEMRDAARRARDDEYETIDGEIVPDRLADSGADDDADNSRDNDLSNDLDTDVPDLAKAPKPSIEAIDTEHSR